MTRKGTLDARCTIRLEFLMRHLSGKALRRLVGVMTCTGDITEFRRAIDAESSARLPTDQSRLEWVLQSVPDFELARITGTRAVTDDVAVVVGYLDEIIEKMSREGKCKAIFKP